MESSAGHRMQIADLRCPDIKGLPVDILQMRRSIESVDLAAESGRKAGIEGLDLLARLKAEGF